MRPSWCWRKFSISLGEYARGNKRYQGLVRPSTLFVCSLLLGSNQPLTFLNSFYHSFLLAFIHSFLHSFPLIFLLSFLPCFFHSYIHSFLFSFIYSSIPSFFHSSSYSFLLLSFLSSIYPSFLSSFNHTFFSFLLPKYLSCHFLFFQRYEEVWDYNYCHGETNFNRPGHQNKAIGHFTQVYTILILDLKGAQFKDDKLPNLV